MIKPIPISRVKLVKRLRRRNKAGQVEALLEDFGCWHFEQTEDGFEIVTYHHALKFNKSATRSLRDWLNRTYNDTGEENGTA
jgi:hypothetical protein